MKDQSQTWNHWITGAAALFLMLTLSACSILAPEPTSQVETSINTPILIQTNTPEPTPVVVVETPVLTSEPLQPQFGGFMVLSNHEFSTIDLFGQSMGFRAPAGTMEWIREGMVGVTKKSVLMATNTGLLMVQMDGIQPVDFAGTGRVTAAGSMWDGSRVAWVSEQMTETAVGFQLWAANGDGSNAFMIAERTPEQMQIAPMTFEIVKWTNDGKLIYGTRPDGIGGYILFSGWVDLYLYDPDSQTSQSLYTSEGTNNMCVNSLSDDLTQVAIGCKTIQVTNLVTGAVADLPAVAEQNFAGSAKFSPSGALVAYGVGRGNPDSEFGQVVVAPVDGSVDPRIIASLEGGYYQVLGWIDENALLLSSSIGDNVPSSIWKVNIDGSGLTKLADGWFAGFIY